MKIKVHRSICNHCKNVFFELEGESDEQIFCVHCLKKVNDAVDDGVAAVQIITVDPMTGTVYVIGVDLADPGSKDQTIEKKILNPHSGLPPSVVDVKEALEGKLSLIAFVVAHREAQARLNRKDT